MLEEQRQQIDQIDRQMVALFEERMHTAEKIAEVKAANNLPILDSSREELVIEKVSGYLTDPNLTEALRDFYTELMAISREHQLKWSAQMNNE